MDPKPAGKRETVGAILITILLVGGFVLLSFAPGVPAATRCILVGVALALGGLISWAVLDNYFKKSLGRAMRASPPKAGAVPEPAEPESSKAKRRSAPARPFAYQLFDLNSSPDLSAAGGVLLQRGHRYYQRYVLNLCLGAVFLWATCALLSLVSGLVNSQVSISADLLCALSIGLLLAFLVANPRRYPTSWTVIVWGALTALFALLILYMAVASAVLVFTEGSRFGPVLVISLGAGILAIYGLLFLFLSAGLRREVAANKPAHLLVLWVFNSANNLISTLSGIGLIWQFLGTWQFLRGGGLTVEMGDLVTKRRGDWVVDTPARLTRALRAFRRVPGWSGAYARNTLLCGDAVWKSAVDALLQDADAVAMSLFGFSKSNQGCLYELGLLLDTFPVSRVLFLVDQSTDLDFLLDTLRENWNHMAADSPNHTATGASVRIYRVSTRFDRPLEQAVLNGQVNPQVPGQPALVQAFSGLSAIQAQTAREVDCMVKLILESVVC